jgi:hypothetical protein
MASHKDVTNHHDLSKAGPAPGKDTNPRHAQPHEAVPVRVSKESGFAGPGSDAPAETQRPAREAGTESDHPVNRPLRDEDRSLIGPALGRGGTTGPRRPSVDATCVYTSPGQPTDKLERNADIAAANANFEDVSSLIMRPRGGASNGD